MGFFFLLCLGRAGGKGWQGCVWVCSFSCHLEFQLVLFFVLLDIHRALLCSTCGNIHCLGFHWYSLFLLFFPCLVFTSFPNVPPPTAWNRSSLCSLYFIPGLSPAAFSCSSYLFQDLSLITTRTFCCHVTGFPPGSWISHLDWAHAQETYCVEQTYDVFPDFMVLSNWSKKISPIFSWFKDSNKCILCHARTFNRDIWVRLATLKGQANCWKRTENSSLSNCIRRKSFSV